MKNWFGRLGSFFASKGWSQSIVYPEIKLLRDSASMYFLPQFSTKGYYKLNRLLQFTRAVWFCPPDKHVATESSRGKGQNNRWIVRQK